MDNRRELVAPRSEGWGEPFSILWQQRVQEILSLYVIPYLQNAFLKKENKEKGVLPQQGLKGERNDYGVHILLFVFRNKQSTIKLSNDGLDMKQIVKIIKTKERKKKKEPVLSC